MKVRLNALGLLFLSCSLFGQNQDKKGFVGLNMGVSFILNKQYNASGNPDLKTGANLNLINLGYELKGGFGVVFTLMGALHADKVYGPDLGSGPFEMRFHYSYGALTVGPMYSFRLSETIKLDCRLQPGLFWINDKTESELGKSVNQKSTLKGFTSGLTLRHNFSQHWCWMIAANYTGEQPKGINIFSGSWLNIINLNAGVGYRI